MAGIKISSAMREKLLGQKQPIKSAPVAAPDAYQPPPEAAGLSAIELLFYAVENNDIGLLAYGLRQNATLLDQANKYGESALELACRKQQHDMALYLLEMGANPNGSNRARLNHSNAPIIMALQHNNSVLAEQLMLAGAELDLKTYDGDQLTHLAVQKNNPKLLRLLLEAGLDANAANNRGESPIHCLDTKTGEECLGILAEHGANLNKRDLQGDGMMHQLATEADSRLLKKMIALGASPTLEDSKGNSPLHLAASAGCVGNAKLLLAAGAKLEQRNHQGDTAYDCARQYYKPADHLKPASLWQKIFRRNQPSP